MGQEAYAMFPMLAEASARAAALRQATAQGATTFGQQQEGQNIFGQVAGSPESQGGYPPGGVSSLPPEPGQASVPNIRVPQPPQMAQPPMSAGGQPVPAGSSAVAVGATPGFVSPVPSGGTPAPGDASAQGGQPPAGQPAQPPPQQGQPGSVSLDHFMTAARKKFPNASGQALAQAANYYLPFMTEEDQARLKELLYANNAAYHQGQLGIGQEKVDLGQTQEAGRNARSDARIAAANARAAQSDATRNRVADMIDALGKQRLAQAQALGDQKAALAAQNEARLFHATADQIEKTYNTAVANAGFETDPDAKAQKLEDAVNVRQQALEALANDAQKAGTQTPTPPGKGNKLDKTSMNTPAPGTPEWGARRLALGLPARPNTGMVVG